MKKTLLITSALFINLGGAILNAQTDITSQYIINPGFEDCEAVEITECKGYSSVVHGNGHCLMIESSVAHGYDYESTGWKLESQNTNANGGVVVYGNKVQYSKSGFEDVPASGPLATSGTKALCFCGNNNLYYQQPTAVTLPAGFYKMTIHVFAYNGAYSTLQPTTKVKDCTGFVANNGKEYFNEDRSENKETTFNSNKWNKEEIYFELTEPTTGHFQVSYGTQYFVVVDDITLEGETGIITSGLKKVITKATALNTDLSNSDLSTAISNAEAVIASPTDQAAVTTQIETLYSVMATALSAATGVVNITSAYLENSSFEAERKYPWDWGTNGSGIIGEASEIYQPYIDGVNMVDFYSGPGGSILQTISHLPAGFYAIDAKMNGTAYLILGKTISERQICTGGKDPLFLRYHPNIYELTTPTDLIVGISGSGKYRVDDFRLFYGKEAASLEARLLADVKADAQAILDNKSFADITGSERTAIESALQGNDYRNINIAVNNFITSLTKYEAFAKKKSEAESYTKEAYPYATASLFDDVQTIVNTTATSATNATELTTQLNNLLFQVYVSNAYCEGVDKTDYTDHIKEANIAAAPEYWAMQNMSVIQSSVKAWKNPKTNTSDNTFFGTSSSYSYNTATKKALILKQTIQGLPAGKYVLSMTMMAGSNLNVHIFFNSKLIGTVVGKGVASGGKYGLAWNDYTFEFTKTGDDDQPLQIQCTPTSAYPTDVYIDNFRLYLLNTATGIQNVQRTATERQAIYDLQGRRIAQPGKGLYIVNGKKVVIK